MDKFFFDGKKKNYPQKKKMETKKKIIQKKKKKKKNQRARSRYLPAVECFVGEVTKVVWEWWGLGPWERKSKEEKEE